MRRDGLELVFIPIPSIGHIRSAVQLAKLILQRNERISITIPIIYASFLSPTVSSYLESQSRDNPFLTRLTFVTLPPLSNSPEPSTPNYYNIVISLHKPLIKQAVEERIRAGFPKPAGFVLDVLCTVMMDIANELHVPSYVFFPTAGQYLNLIFYAQMLADKECVDVATEFNRPEFSACVPGFKNPITINSIPALLQDKEFGCEMIINIGRKIKESKGVLVNTFHELESFGVETLIQNDDKTNPPIYPVGPILDLESMSRGGLDEKESEKKKEKESLLQWLDNQPKSSVVFLCFGSLGTFDEVQNKEIAHALDRSGYRFLWSLRTPPPDGGAPCDIANLGDFLPEGFLDRTIDNGKIIGWAPQIEILSHPAIGGFVSHCGWNSILESLWFNVPIATWSVYAEHQLMAFELVKELELAVEISIDYKMDWKTRKGNVFVTADVIEMGLKNLMNMDEKMRAKVKEISEKSRNTIKDGGSSYLALDRFIESMVSNIA